MVNGCDCSSCSNGFGKSDWCKCLCFNRCFRIAVIFRMWSHDLNLVSFAFSLLVGVSCLLTLALLRTLTLLLSSSTSVIGHPTFSQSRLSSLASKISRLLSHIFNPGISVSCIHFPSCKVTKSGSSKASFPSSSQMIQPA